jgi:hypothetical protein
MRKTFIYIAVSILTHYACGQKVCHPTCDKKSSADRRAKSRLHQKVSIIIYSQAKKISV